MSLPSLPFTEEPTQLSSLALYSALSLRLSLAFRRYHLFFPLRICRQICWCLHKAWYKRYLQGYFSLYVKSHCCLQLARNIGLGVATFPTIALPGLLWASAWGRRLCLSPVHSAIPTKPHLPLAQNRFLKEGRNWTHTHTGEAAKY